MLVTAAAAFVNACPLFLFLGNTKVPYIITMVTGVLFILVSVIFIVRAFITIQAGKPDDDDDGDTLVTQDKFSRIDTLGPQTENQKVRSHANLSNFITDRSRSSAAK